MQASISGAPSPGTLSNPAKPPGARTMKHYLKVAAIAIIAVAIAKRVPVIKDYL
jgi:hypothetical protein